MAEQFHAEEPLKNETRQKIADARLRLSQPKKRRPRWQPVVACACALALAVGLSVIPQPQGVSTSASSQVNQPNGFLLTAYAADKEITLPNEASHDLIIVDGPGYGGRGIPYYTGLSFQIQGTNIATVALSIDKGNLYYNHDASTNDPATKELLENPVILPWKENMVIGFALDAETDASIPELYDLREDAHQRIDYFNGATLTVTITFLDGTKQTDVHHLKTGRLKVETNSEGGWNILPIEVPESEKATTTYTYAIYDEDFVS